MGLQTVENQHKKKGHPSHKPNPADYRYSRPAEEESARLHLIAGMSPESGCVVPFQTRLYVLIVGTYSERGPKHRLAPFCGIAPHSIQLKFRESKVDRFCASVIDTPVPLC